MQIIGAIKSQGYGIITQDFKNTCDFYSKKNSGSNEDESALGRGKADIAG